MLVPDNFGRKCQWLSETSSGRQNVPSSKMLGMLGEWQYIYEKNGVLKEVKAIPCWREQKGGVKSLSLLRLVLCHGTLGPYLVYSWNPFLYLLAFSIPHFLHWVESYLLLFTYTVFMVFITNIVFHLASVLGSLLSLSPKFQLFLTSLFFLNRGGLNIFSPLFLYILGSNIHLQQRAMSNHITLKLLSTT